MVSSEFCVSWLIQKVNTGVQRCSSKKIDRKEEDITSLRDDGSGSNHNDRPVELALKVGDNLFGDLAEGGQRSVRDLDDEDLGS